MRKVLLTLVASSLLLTQITPTIIITNSVPKFFQISANKMAIVIDEDEAKALDTLSKATSKDKPSATRD